ncbi:hypothetical protein DDI_2272 [Dickeya dianthicola RNS04.9]|uniref:hypothetical protein n=1 Tax=Dickeya dianthicola TaxID=204039 RepID=UPI0003A87022|nr:hypothetical protein [Dickeya dianthicola]ATO33440.1 hypothetical protein DDI_2272 [Dickeya dianthicola RNS04.9]MBI0487807.1 hypothetical protein [Dickeya dianthicola]
MYGQFYFKHFGSNEGFLYYPSIMENIHPSLPENTLAHCRGNREKSRRVLTARADSPTPMFTQPDFLLLS